MSRTKGTTNKQPADHPEFLDMPIEERLAFIANLIVDQMASEQTNILELLKELEVEEAVVK